MPDDIFRPTAVPDPAPEALEALEAIDATDEAVSEQPRRTPSGRVKHDEKMTVYVTSDELLDIEAARLDLRRHHALAVDRGRIVRAAVALALADLDEHGADSPLVQRLSQQA